MADGTSQTSDKHCETMPAGRSLQRGYSQADVSLRWQALGRSQKSQALLADSQTVSMLELYRRNVEHLIGTVKVPVGVAGPLHVKGALGDREFFVPLATTEATLVASYNRGSRLPTAAGGCTAHVLDHRVARAPGLVFRNLSEVETFIAWAKSEQPSLAGIVASTTRYGRLLDTAFIAEGNHLYLILNFSTGDAAGQNMVTIATAAVCAYIQEHSPVTPQRMYVEANISGDKKASAQCLLTARGRKVAAEAFIPATLIESSLHTTPEEMTEYFRVSAIGGVLSGTVGIQGHYANALAAAYIACGQDVACVAESAVGVTRFEMSPARDLYASVTLPNLMVGTVGGGTSLPSQRACLEIMGLSGAGQANTLAEVLAALCLAGELSIVGAICAGEFTAAHQRMAREQLEVTGA